MDRVTFGPGALDSLPGIAAGLSGNGGGSGARPPLLLAGHTAAERPWLLRIRDRLPRHVFATMSGSYPTWTGVDRVADLMIAHKTGPVIAIGGGSVMDTAKVAVARAAQIDRRPRRPEEQVAQHEGGHHVGDDLVPVVPGIALALVGTVRAQECVVDEQRTLTAERFKSLRDMCADSIPRSGVGQLERHGLEIRVRAPRDADDLRVGPGAEAGQRLTDARGRSGDPQDVRPVCHRDPLCNAASAKPSSESIALA